MATIPYHRKGSQLPPPPCMSPGGGIGHPQPLPLGKPGNIPPPYGKPAGNIRGDKHAACNR